MGREEQVCQQDLQRVAELRYMDDEFMSVCLEDNYEGVELILRIVLGQPGIKVKSLRTQELLKNLQGRSAILDVHAVDSAGREFDVEIQRASAGADAKRARHNSSLLDAHILKSGESTADIPDSYVIFITEKDVMKGNQPVYPVERYVTIGESKVLFGDGSHILYVNGTYRGNDEVGKLMHDFSCTNPDDMHYEALAKKARYYKRDVEGVKTMSRILDEMRAEAEQNKAKRIAVHLIELGNISLEKIAEATELSLDEVKELENQYMPLV